MTNVLPNRGQLQKNYSNHCAIIQKNYGQRKTEKSFSNRGWWFHRCKSREADYQEKLSGAYYMEAYHKHLEIKRYSSARNNSQRFSFLKISTGKNSAGDQSLCHFPFG